MAKKTFSEPYLKALYNKFSRRYRRIFGPMPKSQDIIVRWGSYREMNYEGERRIKALWGWAIYDKKQSIILIDGALRKKRWFKTAQVTLLHEMSHISLKGRDKHGRVFKKKRIRALGAAGAFDDLL